TTGAAQVSEIRLVREAGNPALLDVFIAGKKIITTPQATVGLLNITGGAGNENLVLDVSQGLISMPGGISFDGGGGTNSATVTGNTRVTDGTTTTDLTSGLVTRSSLSAGFENQSLFLVNVQTYTDTRPNGSSGERLAAALSAVQTVDMNGANVAGLS